MKAAQFCVAGLGCVLAAGLAGCAATTKDLAGDRMAVIQPLPQGTPAGTVRDVPTNFMLRNNGLAPVKVESMRVPIGTTVLTDPALPATIRPNGTLVVTVISKVRAGDAMQPRTVLLETKGQPPIELTVRPAVPTGT